jgi:hypothetical protein
MVGDGCDSSGVAFRSFLKERSRLQHADALGLAVADVERDSARLVHGLRAPGVIGSIHAR